MSRPTFSVPLAARWACLATLALVFAATIVARSADAAPADQLTVADDVNTPVIDRAGVIDAATRQQLFDWLRELREKTQAQVKVLTVPSLQGEDLFSFAQRHAELWKLGEKGKDDGVLIVLAPKEHKLRIQVGYGLEGVLPDSWCGTAERQVAKLYFSQGQYSQGMAQLVQTVAGRIAADKGVKLTGVPDPSMQLGGAANDPGVMVFVFVFLIMIIAIIAIAQMQRRQQNRWGHRASGWGQNNFPPMPGGMWGMGGGDFGGGGGGWSSGGGGGFGGGGGGFGGGGAETSW